jgi:hypothetical protein
LPNTGFILEPYLKGLTLCMFWHELDYPLCQGSCPLLYFSLIFRWAG